MFRGAALFQKVNNKHMLAQNCSTHLFNQLIPFVTGQGESLSANRPLVSCLRAGRVSAGVAPIERDRVTNKKKQSGDRDRPRSGMTLSHNGGGGRIGFTTRFEAHLYSPDRETECV